MFSINKKDYYFTIKNGKINGYNVAFDLPNNHIIKENDSLSDDHLMMQFQNLQKTYELQFYEYIGVAEDIDVVKYLLRGVEIDNGAKYQLYPIQRNNLKGYALINSKDSYVIYEEAYFIKSLNKKNSLVGFWVECFGQSNPNAAIMVVTSSDVSNFFNSITKV